MKGVFIVYEERSCEDIHHWFATPCATLEIAKRVIKEKLDWYCYSTIIRDFVGNLDNDDIWEVDDNSVKIHIVRKDIKLNLYISMGVFYEN
jgi:hypothetical protein